MNTKYTNPALQQEPIGEPASIIAPRENESLFRWIKSTGRFMPSQSERFNDDKEINESASNHNRRSPSKPQLHKYKPVCYEILVNIVCMKTKALNIRTGDRIIAFFKNKMQVCTVKQIFTSDQAYTKLLVFPGEHYRHTRAGTIQFKSETLVDLIEQKSLVCKP